MSTFNNDDLDDELEGTEEEEVTEAGAAKPANNRNFMLALGVLGGIFLLLVIALIFVALTRPRQTAAPAIDIAATNNVISTSNAVTAAAATQARAMLLTPSVTPTATITPTITKTPVLAATNTLGAAGASGGLTPTATGAVVGVVDTRTATVAALLTQRAQTAIASTPGNRVTVTVTRTPTRALATTGPGTPTRLPQAGFVEDVGLPGLFALAAGFLVVIVLVRRLRFATQPQ